VRLEYRGYIRPASSPSPTARSRRGAPRRATRQSGALSTRSDRRHIGIWPYPLGGNAWQPSVHQPHPHPTVQGGAGPYGIRKFRELRRDLASRGSSSRPRRYRGDGPSPRRSPRPRLRSRGGDGRRHGPRSRAPSRSAPCFSLVQDEKKSPDRRQPPGNPLAVGYCDANVSRGRTPGALGRPYAPIPYMEEGDISRSSPGTARLLDERGPHGRKPASSRTELSGALSARAELPPFQKGDLLAPDRGRRHGWPA